MASTSGNSTAGSDPRASRKGSRLWIWLLISATMVLLDQATKIAAESQLILHRPVPVIPNLNWMLAYNPGAAFSFLSEAGGWQRWFFTVLSSVVSVVLVVWLARIPRSERWLPLAISLILAGALGNLIDRVLYGHVIDFIQFYYLSDSCLIGFYGIRGSCYWPAFNIADSVIFIGAALLIGHSFLTSKENEAPQ